MNVLTFVALSFKVNFDWKCSIKSIDCAKIFFKSSKLKEEKNWKLFLALRTNKKPTPSDWGFKWHRPQQKKWCVKMCKIFHGIDQ